MATEKRLIDANKIKYRTVGAGGWGQPENVVSDHEIEKMPTVDAAEVVHGRWLKVKDSFDIDRGWKCSSCNNYVYAMTYEPYEYCPHCGAMMDGEREYNG